MSISCLSQLERRSRSALYLGLALVLTGTLAFVASPAALASGSPPVVGTSGVEVTGPTTARIVGDASPEGQKTMLHAGYAMATEPWCISGGVEGVPSETTPVSIGAMNGFLSEILVSLSGLAPEREYCAALVAQNESGTSTSEQRRFKTASPCVEDPQDCKPPPSPCVEDPQDCKPPPSPCVEDPQDCVAPQAPTPTPSPLGALPSNASAQPNLDRAESKLARALNVCKSKPKRQRAACRKHARVRYAKRIGALK